ncbi:MAG TPA: hypothetical protein P5307_21850, partial [Pirellulaceae bacterium]|nr:hypothetical protein [Pirellulaceae bacterium]
MNSVPIRIGMAMIVVAILFGQLEQSFAGPAHDSRSSPRSLSRDRLEWPSADDIQRTLLLRDYNTR